MYSEGNKMKSEKLSILNEILGLSIPIIGVRILYIFVGIVGMWLIAHLGKTYMAAGAIVTATTTSLIVIALSPLLSINIIIGKLYGQKKLLEIGNVIRHAWLISLAIGISTAIILCNLKYIFYKLHQPSELIPLACSYLRGLAWGVIPSLIIATCQQLCFAVHREKLVVFWGSVSLVLSIFMGTLFIFGYLGCPALGFCGWSYAGSIVNWLLLLGVITYLYLSNEFKPFQIFVGLKEVDWLQMKAILKLSWPITVQFSGELAAFAMLTFMVGWIGADQLSVQQILTQCSTMALMIPVGSSQAISILISQKIGQKQHDKIRLICYLGVTFTIVCMVLIALCYWFMPMKIMQLYINPSQMSNKSLLNTTETMLALLAVTQIIDAVRNLFIGALRGLEDVRQPMWINIIILWGLGIPCSYLLGFKLNQGIFGINMGFLIAFTLGAFLMLHRFHAKTSQYKISTFNDASELVI
jgi:MATE family multidrug resistance protein